MNQQNLKENGGYQLSVYRTSGNYYQLWKDGKLEDWALSSIFYRSSITDLYFKSITDAKRVAEIAMVDHFKILKSDRGFHGDEVYCTPELKRVEKKIAKHEQEMRDREELRTELKTQFLDNNDSWLVMRFSDQIEWRLQITSKKGRFGRTYLGTTDQIIDKKSDKVIRNFYFESYVTQSGAIQKKQFRSNLSWFNHRDRIQISPELIDEIMEEIRTIKDIRAGLISQVASISVS